MKKILALTIALLSVMTAAAGCGKKSSSDSEKSTKSTSGGYSSDENNDGSSDKPDVGDVDVPDENGENGGEGGFKTPEEDPDSAMDERTTAAAEQQEETTTTEAEQQPTDESGEPVVTQPDPLAPKPVTTTTVTTTGEAVAAATTTTQPASTTPPDANAYEQDEHGAVVFVEPEEEVSDSTVIAAAQTLFDAACRTQWDFTVGCPYDVDNDDYIETDFGWKFYRIDDSSITSFADIENDYYKVFSRKYTNKLDELYIEGSGCVYAICGSRGSDLYYESSVVTSIESRSDNEIVFNVDNYYSGDDFDPENKRIETEKFSVVIDDDGTWRAGEFRLPF